MRKRKSVYHQCLMLANLIYSLVRHFPKSMKSLEGLDLKDSAIQLVKYSLFLIRSNDTNMQLTLKKQINNHLIEVEALVAIINNIRMCSKALNGLLVCGRLISSSSEVRLQTLILSIKDCIK